MIYQVALVGMGGAAGSILRFLLQRGMNAGFPFGTSIVNLAGCFLIGALWSYFSKGSADQQLRLLLITGFCGGFTTFSAFTQESIAMLQENRITTFFAYLIISVAGGFAATFTGYKLFSS
jgi:CrcB protein